jgi:hypothetical protein
VRVEILVDHLIHDGERIAQGAVLDLEAAAAATLVAIGAARLIAEAKVEEPAPAPRRKRSE